MSERFNVRDIVFKAFKMRYQECIKGMRSGVHPFRVGLCAEMERFVGLWMFAGERPKFSEPLALRQELINQFLEIMDGFKNLETSIKFRLMFDFSLFLAQESAAKQDACLAHMLAAMDRRKQEGITIVPVIPGGGVVKAAPTPAPVAPDPTVVTMTVEVLAAESSGQDAGQQARI